MSESNHELDSIVEGFVAESREHLSEIENEILTIEELGADVDGELVKRTSQDRPSRVVQVLERGSALWGLGVRALRGLGYRFPVGDWWHLNRVLLDGIRASCREAGVPVLFVYIPSSKWRTFGTLRAHMAETRQHFVDLTDPTLSPAPRPQQLFFPKDGHINERGHRLVADAILPVVQGILGD